MFHQDRRTLALLTRQADEIQITAVKKNDPLFKSATLRTLERKIEALKEEAEESRLKALEDLAKRGDHTRKPLSEKDLGL